MEKYGLSDPIFQNREFIVIIKILNLANLIIEIYINDKIY